MHAYGMACASRSGEAAGTCEWHERKEVVDQAGTSWKRARRGETVGNIGCIWLGASGKNGREGWGRDRRIFPLQVSGGRHMHAPPPMCLGFGWSGLRTPLLCRLPPYISSFLTNSGNADRPSSRNVKERPDGR